MRARSTAPRSSTTPKTRSALPRPPRRSGRSTSRFASRSSRRSRGRARSTRRRTTTRTITRKTRCSTSSTSPAAAATRASTPSGDRSGSSPILGKSSLFLGALLADALGFLHRLLLFLALRLGFVRRLVDLARLDELLGALVVVLGARVAAFAFDAVFPIVFHSRAPCVGIKLLGASGVPV